jgi:hypothetical protein
MTTRNEAAIANAMLLGDLVSRDRWNSVSAPQGEEYAFIGPRPQPFYTKYEHTIEQAAWMFLLSLGYGIEPDGLGLIKLRDKHAPK